MYKVLRISAAIVLGCVAVAIATAVLNIGGIGTRFGGWLMHMQLVEAVLTASFGWLVFWTVVTLLFGRLYCSTACPMGALMDAVAWLSRKFRRQRANYFYMRGRTTLRVLVVIVMVEVVCLGITALVGILDPYSNYVRILEAFTLCTVTAWGTALAVLAVVVAFSWRNGRLICNTICPVGSVLGAVTKVSALRFDINPDLCTHCGECERVCKSQCIDQKSNIVDNSRCVTCFDCAAVCPCGAITWRVGRHRLQWPLLQRVETQLSATGAPQTTSQPMRYVPRRDEQTAKTKKRH